MQSNNEILRSRWKTRALACVIASFWLRNSVTVQGCCIGIPRVQKASGREKSRDLQRREQKTLSVQETRSIGHLEIGPARLNRCHNMRAKLGESEATCVASNHQLRCKGCWRPAITAFQGSRGPCLQNPCTDLYPVPPSPSDLLAKKRNASVAFLSAPMPWGCVGISKPNSKKQQEHLRCPNKFAH